MSTLVAKWQSRNGAYTAELHKAEGSGFYYRGVNCGGYLGNDISESDALILMEARCQGGAGYFQPDANKTAMKLVYRRESAEGARV